MKRTIELPEELVDLLDKYLKYHGSEELCRLLKSAIPLEPEFKDLSRLIFWRCTTPPMMRAANC